MKVAFINRPKDSWIGGDYVQMEKTADELRKLGIEVTIFETPFPLPTSIMNDIDIVHLWNFTMDWTKSGIWMAKGHKKKTVCSMIYHDVSSISDETQQIMIDNLDRAIFLCPQEKERADKHIKVTNYVFIPNGIDKWWLEPVDYKTEDYVLTVGRIDGTKGQLEVAKECKKLGLKYKIVGENINHEYLKLCQKNGVEYLGVLTGDKLKEVYAKCRVYVLKSNTEIMPLTVMEAGALNKPVVLNDKCLFKFPGISNSIEEAWNKTDNKELYDFISKTTWESIAKLIKQQYETINNNASI